MYRALAIKELRDSAGLAVLGVLAMTWLLATEMQLPFLPWSSRGMRYHIPFVAGEFTFYFTVISAAIAIGLGLKQSAWELWQGTFHFLLHRPVPRQMLFVVKLLLGLGLLCLLSAVPILLYALWAATPGNTPTPFHWSMTAASWSVWLVMPAVYLGAFLCGVRPGNWIGTRFVPLAGAALGASVAGALLNVAWWWPAGLALLVFLYVVLTVSILYFAEQRDY
jgi:hypothetical protein